MSYVHEHGLPTPEEAAARYPHGTRARYYLGKCKCFPCRLANSDYETARAAARRGPWQKRRLHARLHGPLAVDATGAPMCRFCGAARTSYGITRHERACAQNPNRGFETGWVVEHRETGERRGPVYATNAEAAAARDRLNKRDRPKPPNQYVSASKARAHLRALAKLGVGVKSIGASCGVAPSVLDRIKRGMIKRTRRATEAKILATSVETAARGRAKIDGAPTWKLLDDLLRRGFTKTWVAQQLGGPQARSLQIKRDVVSGETARKVRELHARLAGQHPPARTGRWKFAPPPTKPVAREVSIEDLPPATPLSKRDPAIKKRWDDLFRVSAL